jgi:hypothetical protein
VLALRTRLSIQVFAVLAQPVAGCSGSALSFGDVVAGRTFVVVVMDPILGQLLNFIDGVEGINRHQAFSSMSASLPVTQAKESRSAWLFKCAFGLEWMWPDCKALKE